MHIMGSIVCNNGTGITEEQLIDLNSDMSVDLKSMYDANGDSAHGVGLQLVKEIEKTHSGTLKFVASKTGGISTIIEL